MGNNHPDHLPSENNNMKCLVSLEKFLEVKTAAIDSIIPEIRDKLSLNLNNDSQFDSVLRYLEMSWGANKEEHLEMQDRENNYIVVPSEGIFRILLTLAARNERTLYTKDSIHVRGIKVSSAYADIIPGSISMRFNQRTLTKRCVNQFNLYLNFISSSWDKTLSSSLAYERIRKTLLEFLVDPKDISSASVSQVIKGMHRVDDDPDDDIVNDSEDIPTLNSSSKDVHAECILQTAKNMAEKSSSVDLILYDEHLLGKQLNPTWTNYSIWKLIEWTYFCALQSSTNELGSSSYSRLHTTYAALLHIILNFIFIDIDIILLRRIGYDRSLESFKSLKKEGKLKNDLSFNEKNSSASDNGCLMCNFFTLLDNDQSTWYDRIVQSVFLGLFGENFQNASPCFMRELTLINEERSLGKLEANFLENNNTSIIDSIHIRYTIFALAYYQALLFQDVPSSQRSSRKQTLLSSKALISKCANFLSKIEFKYMKEFLFVQLDENRMPKFSQLNLKLRLLKSLLENACGAEIVLHSENLFGLHSESEAALLDIRRLVDLACNEDTYLEVIEDETYHDIQDFFQSWQKLIFYLQQLMLLIVSLVPAELRIQLSEILSNIKEVDLVTDVSFNQFIKNHREYKEYYKFTITEDKIPLLSQFKQPKFEGIYNIHMKQYSQISTISKIFPYSIGDCLS